MEGGHIYGCEGVWEPLEGFGSFCGGFRHSGDASSGSNFHFGIFRSKRHFRSYQFFSALTTSQRTFMNFFVFQNPAVCYFAHIASIAENKNFEICVFRGRHARIFLYFKVPWQLRYVSVKSVQTDIQTSTNLIWLMLLPSLKSFFFFFFYDFHHGPSAIIEYLIFLNK